MGSKDISAITRAVSNPKFSIVGKQPSLVAGRHNGQQLFEDRLDFSIELDEISSDESRIEPLPPGPVCSWTHVQQLLPTPQCGFNDLSVPNGGICQCGKTVYCSDTCIFVCCIPL